MIERELDLTLEQPCRNAEIRGNLGVGTALETGCNEDRAAARRQLFQRLGEKTDGGSSLGDPLGIELIVFEPQQKLGFGSCQTPVLGSAVIGSDIERNAKQIGARTLHRTEIAHALQPQIGLLQHITRGILRTEPTSELAFKGAIVVDQDLQQLSQASFCHSVVLALTHRRRSAISRRTSRPVAGLRPISHMLDSGPDLNMQIM